MKEFSSFEEKFNDLAVFFNAAAHELRTPVTTGKIYIQLLQEQLKDADPLAKENLLKAEAQLNKLNQLIGNILDVSRMHTGKFKVINEEVDLNEALTGAIQFKQANLTKFKFSRIGNAHVKVSGNRERIIQIVMNLLDNAMKFSKPGDEILLETIDSDEYINIQISDHGKGIDPADLPMIFNDDFKKNKSEKSAGLGIGLFVSKAIADQMNAQLQIESELNKGTTVTLRLLKSSATES